MPSLPATLSAVLLVALSASCVIVQSDSKTNYTGRHVSAETLAQVRPDATQDYVLALIGEPTSKTALQDGSSIWKWSYTRTESSSGSFIILFSGGSRTETQGAAYVEFTAAGLVSKTWRD